MINAFKSALRGLIRLGFSKIYTLEDSETVYRGAEALHEVVEDTATTARERAEGREAFLHSGGRAIDTQEGYEFPWQNKRPDLW